MHSTTPKKIPWRWSSERWEPEGLPDPALSAPAVLRWRGNWIHRSKMATQQDHYHQSLRGELEKCLPHLTLQRSPSHHQKFSLRFPSEKCQRNTFPRRSASSDIPEYLLPPHPSERNSQHTPTPRPPVSVPLHLPPTAGATADGLVTLDHVSLQEFCPALSKQSQGHYSS